MHLDLNTPGLLFPALSLLLLAYTNRFLALANVIRQLHAAYKTAPDPRLLAQIANLRWRIRVVRNMQFSGVLSLLLCTICLFLLYCRLWTAADTLFVISMLAMMLSLCFSLVEIQASVHALDLHLQDLEHSGLVRGSRKK